MALSVQTILGRSQLFQDMPASTLSELASLTHRRVVHPEGIVFAEHSAGDALYGVITGRVRIAATTENGKELFLNLLQPGDVFGEIALLDGEPRSASAVAISKVELFVLRRDAFLAQLANHSDLALQLLKLLCARVRWSSGIAEDLALLEVPGRIARRLICLTADRSESYGVEPVLSLSQQDLAGFLGLSRQVVNQQLQAWKERKWIELGRGKLIIKDRRALETLTLSGRSAKSAKFVR